MSTEEKPGRMPIPPQVRRRLQALFENGTKNAQTGNFDYATEMFTQALKGDPGNPIYVKAFLSNLNRKYNNNLKGSKFAGPKTMLAKGSLKKSVAMKKWQDVVETGLEILKENPWDVGVLSDLGRACEAMENEEGEVEYLRQALEADKDNADANRLLGRAYDRTGQFNLAIECFTRVLRAVPKDEEAMRALSNLAVKKTIEKGGYEDAETAGDVRARGNALSLDDDESASLTPEEKLIRRIEKDPTDKEAYMELNDLYVKDEIFDKAIAVMNKAQQALGGGDIMIRERQEDAQLRMARQHAQIAEQKAQKEKTPEAIALYKRMQVELNNKETEIYGNRCERYPTNLGFKYELAIRIQRAGKFAEAIKLFQECRSDLKRKSAVQVALGDCFYSIKQYRLALQSYEAAVTELSDRDPEIYKAVLYKAARLAEHLQEWEAAEKHYNHLAATDFGYKDVSQRLDKIQRIRNNSGDPDAG